MEPAVCRLAYSLSSTRRLASDSTSRCSHSRAARRSFTSAAPSWPRRLQQLDRAAVPVQFAAQRIDLLHQRAIRFARSRQPLGAEGDQVGQAARLGLLDVGEGGLRALRGAAAPGTCVPAPRRPPACPSGRRSSSLRPQVAAQVFQVLVRLPVGLGRRGRAQRFLDQPQHDQRLVTQRRSFSLFQRASAARQTAGPASSRRDPGGCAPAAAGRATLLVNSGDGAKKSRARAQSSERFVRTAFPIDAPGPGRDRWWRSMPGCFPCRKARRALSEQLQRPIDIAVVGSEIARLVWPWRPRTPYRDAGTSPAPAPPGTPLPR